MASGGGRTASSLPRHLVLDASQLTVGDIIGHGANGVAHRGILNAEPVCVKVRRAVVILTV
jgi:predicted amidohydrolase